MSEIGIKDQCFGVEVEMTGITRRQAAEALATYFGTSPQYLGTYYDTWGVTDPEGKVWKLMSDSSIRGERKIDFGYRSTSDGEYQVEMILPAVAMTSQATRAAGSCFRQASRTLSAMASHSLSGCPSVTDSAVRM